MTLVIEYDPPDVSIVEAVTVLKGAPLSVRQREATLFANDESVPVMSGATQLALTLVRLLGFSTLTTITEVSTFTESNTMVSASEDWPLNTFLSSK